MWKLAGARSIVLLVAIVALMLSGCGNQYKFAPVKGRITCNGKPAAGGIIIFQPMDDPKKTGRPSGHSGMASSATIAEDGSFTLKAIDGTSGDGALIGPHQIIFQAPPTTRFTIPAEDRAVMSPEEIKATEEEIARRPIYPPLACSTNVEPAEVEVKAGSNEFEFKLQPK
jgi:hypothetical protein